MGTRFIHAHQSKGDCDDAVKSSRVESSHQSKGDCDDEVDERLEDDAPIEQHPPRQLAVIDEADRSLQRDDGRDQGW
jgi:hypothetical protein